MLHPIDKIPIPKIMEDVLNYIEKNTEDYLEYYERAWNAASLLYDLSGAVLQCKFKFETSLDFLCSELNYISTPFEIVPFSYNGGDALNYSWANLTPEIKTDDYICVSFAPGDDNAVLLGNNTQEALQNLLVGQLKSWEEWARTKTPAPNETEQWKSITNVIGIPNSKIEITPGARSAQLISPTPKDGWKFVQCPDGIGVLAEEKYFVPTHPALSLNTSFEEYSEMAASFLRNGKAASAICVLKQARNEYFESEKSHSVIKQMMEAYQILNRESHYKRAEIWLQNQAT